MTVADPVALNRQLYEQDTYAWANHTAALLRDHKFEALDIDHLVEEIEDMSKSSRRSLLSHLRNLLHHLLKWEFQPEFRGDSWLETIDNSRIEMQDLIEDSPSLANQPDAVLAKAYAQARQRAARETRLTESIFPKECPYTLAQILSADWLPE